MSFGKQFKLNSGYNIPTLGYGTWQAAPGEVGAGVYEALKAGYRHLDLAKIYQNQKEVAQGIKKALAEVPGLKREDIFITSKLWNNKHKPEEVQGALEETLQELELDYLDLYLIHWPVAFASGEALFPKKAGNDGEVELYEGVSLTDTWRAMIELLKLKNEKGEKKVRSIGVSNFTVEHLETIINDTNVVPAANQVERHPRLPQPELVKYCKDKNILITGYSAFGNNSFGLPLLVNTPEVKAIAERLSASTGKQVTGAHVILAWSQLDGHSVIPKSVTPSRIRENFQEIELDQEAIDALNALGQNGRRFNIPTTYSPKWDINIFNDEEERNAKHKVILKV